MELQRRIPVGVAPDELWAVMRDAPTVAHCLPGARIVATNPDDSYDVVFALELGPTRLELSGRMEVAYRELERSATITARATDPRRTTRVAVEARVMLEAASNESCLEFDARFAFAGPLAGVARIAARTQADRLIGEFANALGTTAQKPMPSPEPEAAAHLTEQAR